MGQPAAINAIIPHVHMFQAGLSPAGRPIGVFLLLGPTGTGKTRTVEALAEVLHGSAKNLIRVDCGEYQMEHEVSKLIGAPPGYLGHRETQPLLTQARLAGFPADRRQRKREFREDPDLFDQQPRGAGHDEGTRPAIRICFQSSGAG
jgi:hypothetical protein